MSDGVTQKSRMEWIKNPEKNPVENAKWTLFFSIINTVAPYVFSSIAVILIISFQRTNPSFETKGIYSLTIAFFVIYSFIVSIRLDKSIKVKNELKLKKGRTFFIEKDHVATIKLLRYIRYIGVAIAITSCILLWVL